MNTWIRIISVLIAVAAIGWPVTANAFEPAPSDVAESLSIHPNAPQLSGASPTQQVVVIATFRDGSRRDVTRRAAITVESPSVVRVDDKAVLHVVAEGTTTLTAEWSGLQVRSSVRCAPPTQRRPFSFQRDIGEILTRRGCNAAECHGGVKGRGGLKLSLFALHPRTDYEWIRQGGRYQVLTDDVEGERHPRVKPEQPEQSLLLLKATATIDHDGGERFTKNDDDCRRLISWIAAGAPFDEPNSEPFALAAIDVFPAQPVLSVGDAYQLVTTGQCKNGQRTDLTRRVRYESSRPDVATVSDTGLVQAKAPGETVVVISSAGQIASVRVGVVDRSSSEAPLPPGANFIDRFTFARMRRFRLEPSPIASDGDFLRRVCLDLTGTLPPPNRVREFLRNTAPDKRQALIDVLLETPEFSDYWTFRFAELLRVRYGGPTNLGDRYWEWVRRCITTNVPYDDLARQRIASQGFDGAARFHGFQTDIPSLVSEDMRVFLGRRFDCAQCHDHPSEAWSQDQFWGIAAFYGQLTHMGFDIVFDDPEGPELPYGDNGDPELKFRKVLHPRTKKQAAPQYLDSTSPAPDTRHPRRDLAEWIVSQPSFAETIVNRIWGHFFGRGIVEPVDDFSVTNPPTHPQLLAALAADFRENGHDLRRLMRLIATSTTYQLASDTNASNANDTLNLSHCNPRRLDAEVLLDAIASVTGNATRFDRTLAPISGLPSGLAPMGTRAVQLMDPLSFPSQFLEVFGCPNRQSAIPEHDRQPNLQQALHRLVGNTFTEQLAAADGRLTKLIKSGATNGEIVEQFYLAALTRYPTDREMKAILEYMKSKDEKTNDDFFADNAARRSLLEDLVWGLINSKEFAYNH